MKITASILAAAFLLSTASLRPARAEGQSQLTYGVLAVVGIAFLVTAWRMERDDEPITWQQPRNEKLQVVICNPPSEAADYGRIDASAGVGIRGMF